ncbi:hypothetical protein J2Z31_005318 [Sinorhizobium kostiense]|uniref:Uncharacterized protein n=1 Tax=Sinorhizobium kostiense TaxID=76747 RepID=A0ABS4R7A0_9HYPH|nr:hypothetical protein [Sinorhizobium kostiense]MBP2238777.1 hypothetical protein [Sinorhizobium kostiense]
MNDSLRRFPVLQTVDPTGAVADALRWIPRYRAATEQRHAAFMSRWSAGEIDSALVELHFFLTAACRIVAFMKMAADRLGGEAKSHVDSCDFKVMKKARNHFEHIDDQLYGTGKNRPRPITEDGVTRTVHFGLRAADQHMTFGDEALDVSCTYLTVFLSFVDRFLAVVDAVVDAAAPFPFADKYQDIRHLSSIIVITRFYRAIFSFPLGESAAVGACGS